MPGENAALRVGKREGEAPLCIKIAYESRRGVTASGPVILGQVIEVARYFGTCGLIGESGSVVVDGDDDVKAETEDCAAAPARVVVEALREQVTAADLAAALRRRCGIAH